MKTEGRAWQGTHTHTQFLLRDTPPLGPVIPACPHGLQSEFIFSLNIYPHLTPTLKPEVAEQLLSHTDTSPKQKNRDGICNSKLYLQGSVLNYVSCHTLKAAVHPIKDSAPCPSGFQPQFDF